MTGGTGMNLSVLRPVRHTLTLLVDILDAELECSHRAGVERTSKSVREIARNVERRNQVKF